MKRGGYAVLPLHRGRVPDWLGRRMTEMGRAIVEAVTWHYGPQEFLTRLSDPFWFQALGCVMGMDWHSSGITTSVMGALKRGINPISKELGIHVCGGRGKHSRRTPDELVQISDTTGLDGNELVRSSKLTAKVDNTAVQDGFQLYLHSFVISRDGDWAVVQQGMNTAQRLARRYHWLSTNLRSFVEEPHAAITGENMGQILNLTDSDARPTRDGIVSISQEHPDAMMKEVRKLVMAHHHEVTEKDVDLKRLGAVLATAHDNGVNNFADLLLSRGLGPRTLQSLALVSEVIHGTPSRFRDPARFSLAHGGKDGHPFPVPTKIYDRSISVLKDAVDKAKLGRTDKLRGLRQLDRLVQRVEAETETTVDFDRFIAKERHDSPRHGGRTVFDGTKKRTRKPSGDRNQLTFDDALHGGPGTKKGRP